MLAGGSQGWFRSAAGGQCHPAPCCQPQQTGTAAGGARRGPLGQGTVHPEGEEGACCPQDRDSASQRLRVAVCFHHQLAEEDSKAVTGSFTRTIQLVPRGPAALAHVRGLPGCSSGRPCAPSAGGWGPSPDQGMGVLHAATKTLHAATETWCAK